jgi:hypothetical protein
MHEGTHFANNAIKLFKSILMSGDSIVGGAKDN